MIGLVLAARLQRGGGGLFLSSGLDEAGLPKRPPDGNDEIGLPKRVPDEAFVPNPPEAAVVALPNRPPEGAVVALPKRPPVGVGVALLPNKVEPPVGAALVLLPNKLGPPVGVALALLLNGLELPVGAEVVLPNRPPDEVVGKPNFGAVSARGAKGFCLLVDGAPSESLLDCPGAGFADVFAGSFGEAEVSGQFVSHVGSLISRMACSRAIKLWPGYGLVGIGSMRPILDMALRRAPKWIEEHSNEHI